MLFEKKATLWEDNKSYILLSIIFSDTPSMSVTLLVKSLVRLQIELLKIDQFWNDFSPITWNSKFKHQKREQFRYLVL